MIEYVIALYILLEMYHHLYFFVVRKKLKESVKTMTGAEPFSIKRGEKVALLIHGFSSSPGEFKELADCLANENISVYTPLLPGHGTSPERLALVKYTEWIEFLKEEITRLEKSYKEIYLVGNSMGGNLAIILANKSTKIKGVICLGTPMFFKNERLAKHFLLPVLRRLKLFQKKSYSKESLKAFEGKGYVYMSVPLRSLVQVLRLIDISKKELKSLKLPIITAYAKFKDSDKQSDSKYLLDRESSEYIIENVSSDYKVILPLDSQFHSILVDKKLKEFSRHFASFIKNPKFLSK